MEARVKSHNSVLRALDVEWESNLEAIKARLDQFEGGRRNLMIEGGACWASFLFRTESVRIQPGNQEQS